MVNANKKSSDKYIRDNVVVSLQTCRGKAWIWRNE